VTTLGGNQIGFISKYVKRTIDLCVAYDPSKSSPLTTRLADTANGLPESQTELVERMLVWCRDHWGEEPGESTVRQRGCAL
jgi:hypothetical protein